MSLQGNEKLRGIFSRDSQNSSQIRTRSEVTIIFDAFVDSTRMSRIVPKSERTSYAAQNLGQKLFVLRRDARIERTVYFLYVYIYIKDCTRRFIFFSRPEKYPRDRLTRYPYASVKRKRRNFGIMKPRKRSPTSSMTLADDLKSEHSFVGTINITVNLTLYPVKLR